MAINIVAKLFVTCIYVASVTAWNVPYESDQIKSLSNQIENLKSLLNQPSYKYNNAPPVPWDNNNRNSDYERYLRQQYILPILNSISDISEQIMRNINDKAHQQNNNVPFPISYYPPRQNFGDIKDKDKTSFFNIPFGTASGWGAASYGESQSQGSGGSSYSISNPLSFTPYSGEFGSLNPIKTETYSPFSGHSSGLPVVPSRFPDISNRRPADFDENQNWGLVQDPNDDNVKTTPKPPQECNCEEQNKNITSLALKLRLKTTETNPVTCKAVILFCCVPGNNEERRKECFSEHGCPRSYSTGIACLPVLIQAVYTDIYGKL
ncbi:uncharacterized protein LOC106720298 isoform X2 [Papilio machaon]|nr:uncharacterized protein LOC106720298 isoform X2 [Papilio machaon]